MDPSKEQSKMVRIRFRTTATLGENVYQANAHETVEATDEVWALVDKGVADLDPAPGVGTQPYPPWAQPETDKDKAEKDKAERERIEKAKLERQPAPAPAEAPAAEHPSRGRRTV